MACLSSFAATAAPVEATIGTTALKLVLPPGECRIDRALSADAQYLNALTDVTGAETGNGMLAGFADCRQLASWRNGRSPVLDDHGQYQTMLRLADAEIPRAALGRICHGLRQKGDQFYQGLSLDEDRRIAQAADELERGQTRFLGLIGEDANACYSALLQDGQARSGTEKRQVGVYATSIVKGKLVYLYLFTPYRGPHSVGRLVEVAKATMRELQSANTR